MDKIENCLKDFFSSLQSAKLYGVEHQIFKNSVEKSYSSLNEILLEKEELVFGIVGEELVFENDVMFDLSKFFKPAIIFLKEKNIEKIRFSRGLKNEELLKLIVLLSGRKEESNDWIQEQLEIMHVGNVSLGKLSDKEGSQKKEGALKENGALKLYDSTLENVFNSAEAVLGSGDINYLSLKFAINNIVENFSSQYQEFLKLTTVKRYNVETYVHLLNVSILSMYFSSKIGFNKNDVLDLGVAALFHDIGKMYISRKVLTKADKLTDNEFAQIKSHAVLGAEIMLKYVDSLGILPVVVAFEHHLKNDLSGYPRLVFEKRPHIASLIVSICDVYDALSLRRSYKAAYSPDMIYNAMIKDKDTAFDPGLIDKFFKIVGVWPIGSIVSLSDNTVAVVREESAEDVFSPIVEILSPVEKKGLVDLKKNKIKITGFLNPWNEGKDYLKLV
ncbi:MAG: HD domain-containing protein [Candidatus Omnitrophica bacterium]|nr:HD domain-containing protein [Candidatus Omnitrophota bacterium]